MFVLPTLSLSKNSRMVMLLHTKLNVSFAFFFFFFFGYLFCILLLHWNAWRTTWMSLCALKDDVLCVWRSPLYTDLWLVLHFTLYWLKLILVFIKPFLNQCKGKASVLKWVSHSSDSSVKNNRHQRHRGMALIKNDENGFPMGGRFAGCL